MIEYNVRLETWTYLEEYRSGHNEAVLKTVCPQGHGGSNPSSSAQKKKPKRASFFVGIEFKGGIRTRSRASAQARSVRRGLKGGRAAGGNPSSSAETSTVWCSFSLSWMSIILLRDFCSCKNNFSDKNYSCAKRLSSIILLGNLFFRKNNFMHKKEGPSGTFLISRKGFKQEANSLYLSTFNSKQDHSYCNDYSCTSHQNDPESHVAVISGRRSLF